MPKTLPELLAPCGSYQAMLAAVEAGADAVYLGGKSANARCSAQNFTNDELKDAVAYCHMHGVLVYVTLNTLVFDREIEEILHFVAFLIKIGVDALILADIGLTHLIHERYPDMVLHASTQMSIHNKDGAIFASKLGCSRVVPARELSRTNLKQVAESNLETEVFVHGALCVSYSGQCLFSSLVGGRSGNRGQCAQPCRLPFQNDTHHTKKTSRAKTKKASTLTHSPLSLKDLSLAKHMDSLINDGISSLKIEGRMKAPAYVYGVTRIFRRLLNDNRKATEQEMLELEELFSREGFTDGYYKGKTGNVMFGVRLASDRVQSRSLNEQTFSPKHKTLTLSAKILAGEPASLTITLDEKSLTVYGDTPLKATGHPLDETSLRERLAKLGGTAFSTDKNRITVALEDGIFLPVSSVNALRRKAIDALTHTFLQPLALGKKPTLEEKRAFSSVDILANNKTKEKKMRRTATFYQSDILAKLEAKDLAYFDLIFLPLMDRMNMADKTDMTDKTDKTDKTDRTDKTAKSQADRKNKWHDTATASHPQTDFGVFLPPIVTDSEKNDVISALNDAYKSGVRYALFSNIAQLAWVLEAGLVPIGDFRLNVTNRHTLDFFKKLGVEQLVLSPELTLPMVKAMQDASVITYGRIPLMVTECCLIKEHFGCDTCRDASSDAKLIDRRSVAFPIRKEFAHRNVIFNSLPTYMADKVKFPHEHFIFTIETANEVSEVITAHQKQLPLAYKHRRLPQ